MVTRLSIILSDKISSSKPNFGVHAESKVSSPATQVVGLPGSDLDPITDTQSQNSNDFSTDIYSYSP